MPAYFLETTFYIALLAAGIRIAAPLIFAAVGEIFAERAGVLNIGLEGTMLIGTWAAFMGMYFSGSGLVGVLAGIAGGMLITAILGYVCITQGANQIIAGNRHQHLRCRVHEPHLSPHVPERNPDSREFRADPDPFSERIPIVGTAFLHHTILVYLAFVLVPLASLHDLPDAIRPVPARRRRIAGGGRYLGRERARRPLCRPSALRRVRRIRRRGAFDRAT